VMEDSPWKPEASNVHHPTGHEMPVKQTRIKRRPLPRDMARRRGRNLIRMRGGSGIEP
jgi:hypothetical protein